MRAFACDAEEWVAWVSGAGAYGTGVHSLGNVEAVHFARAAAPELPVREALVPAGILEGLYDEELIAVLRSATPIVEPGSAGAKPAARRRRSLQRE